MKCKYGNENMTLNKDEFMWFCSHCGYEKFAVRSCLNFLKKEAKKYTDKDKFVNTWIVKDLAERAWRLVKS